MLEGVKYFIFIILICVFSSLYSEDCSFLYRYKKNESQQKVYNDFNKKLAQKYSDLSFMLEDPEQFINEMNQRFLLQKKSDPSNAYGFDFSEIGMPFIRSLSEPLNSIEKEFEIKIQTIKNKKKLYDYEQGLKFLTKLKDEQALYLKAGRISYIDLIHYSYFYTKMTGVFYYNELDSFNRVLLQADRAIMGYKQGNFEKEYQGYIDNKYRVFEGKANHGNFRKAEPIFAKELFDNERLNLLIIPSHLYFGRDIFNRLLKYDLYIVGAANKPIAADGFMRPPGDFWTHDIYHSAHNHRMKTLMRNGELKSFTQESIHELESEVDIWLKEFYLELAKVDDVKLKKAITLVFFNYHHEQGHPILPSEYIRVKPDPIVYLLYLVSIINKQHPGFNNPSAYIPKAWKWMREFWLPKLSIQNRILKEKM